MSKSGYNTETVEISLDEDEVYEVKTHAGRIGKRLYLWVVLDIKGEPVENAKLTLKGLKSKYSAKTPRTRMGSLSLPGWRQAST